MKKTYLSRIKQTLTLRACSDRTIANYISCIDRFLKYHEGRELKHFKEQDIIDYLKINFIDKNLSACTYNINRAAIIYFYLICFDKSFNKYLLPPGKITKVLPKLIDKNIIIKMIKEEINIKYKIYLCLAFGSGMRVSEIATLRIENIISKESKIKVIGKGKKERFVPLPKFTLNYLRLYYQKNKMTKKEGYFFEGSYNTDHVHPENLKWYFRHKKIKYGISKDFTFHSLRHTFATEYIKNGGSIWELKNILGHSSIQSTSIYLHTAEDFSKVYSPIDAL